MRTLDVGHTVVWDFSERTGLEARGSTLRDELLGSLLGLGVSVDVRHVSPLGGVGRDIITQLLEFCTSRGSDQLSLQGREDPIILEAPFLCTHLSPRLDREATELRSDIRLHGAKQ